MFHVVERSQQQFAEWKLLRLANSCINFNLKDALIEIVEDVKRVGIFAGLEEGEDFIHVECHVVGGDDTLVSTIRH